MGYTHYYQVLDMDAWRRIWPSLVSDARTIVERKAKDIRMCRSSFFEKDEPIIDETGGISLNGYEGCETFFLGLNDEWTFCKTLRNPYDLVVTAILLRAKMLAKDAFDVSSDGEWDEWGPARELVGNIWPEESPVACPWSRWGSDEDSD